MRSAFYGRGKLNSDGLRSLPAAGLVVVRPDRDKVRSCRLPWAVGVTYAPWTGPEPSHGSVWYKIDVHWRPVVPADVGVSDYVDRGGCYSRNVEVVCLDQVSFWLYRFAINLDIPEADALEDFAVNMLDDPAYSIPSDMPARL